MRELPAEVLERIETQRRDCKRPGVHPDAAGYWARPYGVRWADSHFSGTFMFPTRAEAFAYIDQQWQRARERVARERYNASKLRDCWLIEPGRATPLNYVLLADDVSSY